MCPWATARNPGTTEGRPRLIQAANMAQAATQLITDRGVAQTGVLSGHSFDLLLLMEHPGARVNDERWLASYIAGAKARGSETVRLPVDMAERILAALRHPEPGGEQ